MIPVVKGLSVKHNY